MGELLGVGVIELDEDGLELGVRESLDVDEGEGLREAELDIDGEEEGVRVEEGVGITSSTLI